MALPVSPIPMHQIPHPYSILIFLNQKNPKKIIVSVCYSRPCSSFRPTAVCSRARTGSSRSRWCCGSPARRSRTPGTRRRLQTHVQQSHYKFVPASTPPTTINSSNGSSRVPVIRPITHVCLGMCDLREMKRGTNSARGYHLARSELFRGALRVGMRSIAFAWVIY